ncbi:ATP-dependent RNA helicase DbpA [Neptuniibacter sp.]|uniref:ATP-dependent RNA helicase DbpA n=1 Tax=Neptuniibacter sp. TaxID=1962643 RepID=UPI0026305C09|nr:ATP-dependent RNA helicase DbpA [Neptuniibacter sp.]
MSDKKSKTKSETKSANTADNNFSLLDLPPRMIENLNRLGYKQMTEIQAQAIPQVLEGKDLIAKAKTGSGKTAAFGIGLLLKLRPKLFSAQALILCPTRELATQVANELRKLAQYTENLKILTLCGGQSIGPQIGSLQHGAHVIVGTPGRIKDHLRKQTLKLDRVNTLVLDEADRMLDMGFADDIRDIIKHTPEKRQSLLFSATYPKTINQLCSDILRNPVKVEVEATHSKSQIEQYFFEIDKADKLNQFSAILSHYQPEFAVIFCNTKQSCKDVQQKLWQLGYKAKAIHGDLEQKERDQILTQFSNRSIPFLIATDVAARGLDIDDLPCVISYELTRDAEIHTHRIGRTGRAGKTGIALNLYQPSEAYKVNSIEDYLGAEFEATPIPEATEQAAAIQPPMVTLSIAGGKKNKVRPGDILGALTGDAGIPGAQVGKINIFDFVAYVAVEKSVARKALDRLDKGKIKGRRFKVRRI